MSLKPEAALAATSERHKSLTPFFSFHNEQNYWSITIKHYPPPAKERANYHWRVTLILLRKKMQSRISSKDGSLSLNSLLTKTVSGTIRSRSKEHSELQKMVFNTESNPLAPVGAAIKRCPQVIAQPFHLICRTLKKKSPWSGFYGGTSGMEGEGLPL